MEQEFTCQFHISQWTCVSNRLHNQEQWQLWAMDKLSVLDLPETTPDVSFLPPLQRRRLNLSARLLFAAAYPLLAEQKYCPFILVSHDGEINRSFELWQDLFKGDSISPTAFGLSVHNALAAQWLMQQQDTSEHTALATQTEALEIGIIEALGLLADGAKRVLLAIVDEPLQMRYAVSPIIRAPFSYALALIIESGKDWQLSLYQKESNVQSDYYYSALEWLKNSYQNKQDWIQIYPRRQWQWQRK